MQQPESSDTKGKATTNSGCSLQTLFLPYTVPWPGFALQVLNRNLMSVVGVKHILAALLHDIANETKQWNARAISEPQKLRGSIADQCRPTPGQDSKTAGAHLL